MLSVHHRNQIACLCTYVEEPEAKEELQGAAERMARGVDALRALTHVVEVCVPVLDPLQEGEEARLEAVVHLCVMSVDLMMS